MASAAEQLAANFNFSSISKAKELRQRIFFTLGALVVARRVRDRLAAFRVLQALHLDVRLTAAGGIASLPDVTLVPEDLLRAADEAMYRVKERGKNDVILATRA